MKLSELSEKIEQGKFIEKTDTTSSPTKYLYLQPKNIKSSFITEENAQYIIEKNLRKYEKLESVDYGDILVVKNEDTNDFNIFRVSQEFLDKKIIPSAAFIIIKSPSSFLSNIVQQPSGITYIKGELEELIKRKEGNYRQLSLAVEDIDIPLIFEDGKITVAPGNIPVSEEDFQKINIRKGFISTDNLIKRVQLGEIKINGYFQRKSRLWDEGTKSRLIETIIMDIPVPPLYFDVISKNEWLVIDGLQRISTITDFYDDKFALSELDFLSDLKGKKFSELDRPTKRSIEEAELTSYSIQPGTPRTVRYKIFKNINTSALVLSRQEIRHAMNDDEQEHGFTPSKYIAELATILNNYINIPEKEENRMHDRELTLRYVAFKIFFYKTEYIGNIPDFLDKTMESMYSYPKNKLEIYKTDFNRILSVLIEIFDKENLFTKKMLGSDERKGVNGALFEIWTYAISEQSFENQNKLILRAKKIREKTNELKNDAIFMRSIDSRYVSSIEMVKVRFSTILNLVKEVLNDR